MTDEIDEPLGDEEPWLTIVGIGDNGLSSVTPEALPCMSTMATTTIMTMTTVTRMIMAIIITIMVIATTMITTTRLIPMPIIRSGRRA